MSKWTILCTWQTYAKALFIIHRMREAMTDIARRRFLPEWDRGIVEAVSPPWLSSNGFQHVDYNGLNGTVERDGFVRGLYDVIRMHQRVPIKVLQRLQRFEYLGVALTQLCKLGQISADSPRFRCM